MELVKTLKVFDLDETLIRAPGYTSKKQVETDSLKFDSPYSFYDHPASLCEEKHNIQLISPVYEAWLEGHNDDFTRTVLITHRVQELSPEVRKLLDKRSIVFDEMFFLGRKRKKTEVAGELLVDMPDVERVEVYEDSIEQLSLYQTFFSRFNAQRVWQHGLAEVEVLLNIVDKSRVFRLESLKLSDEKKIKLI